MTLKLAAYLHRLDAALEEDIPALVNQQLGMQNPDAIRGDSNPARGKLGIIANWYAKNF